MTTDEIKDLIWKQMEPVVFIARADFMAELEAWSIDPVEIDGRLAFIGMSKGPEFHFISLGSGHRLSFDLVRRGLEPIIEKHGYALTKTPKEDIRQQRFNRAYGFYPVGEDEFYIHYRLDRIRPRKVA